MYFSRIVVVVVFQCTHQTQITVLVSVESYPCCEVHCCPSVEQERGHIDVAIVGSDMQGGESTLEDRRGKRQTYREEERGQNSAFTLCP